MKNNFIKLFTVVILSIPSVSNATGIPTVDIANILQTTLSAFENIRQTYNQYRQIENEIKQIEAITGVYGMGFLLNDLFNKNERRYVPEKYLDVLEMLENGSVPAHQIDAKIAFELALEAYQNYEAEDLFEEGQETMMEEYELNAKRVFGTMGISQTAYNNTDKRVEKVELLAESIEVTENQKSSTDLNSRIAAEQAILTNELIRQVSIQNIQETEKREQDHNDRAADIKSSKVELTYDY